MKVTKLNEARFGYFKYKYGVHLIKQDGRDALLGGSNDLDDATDIAIRQADEVFSNPFMSSKEKYNYLSNMYVSNDDTEEMDVSIDFDNYVDGLMSELSSKKDFKESFEDDEDDEEYDKDFFKGSDGCSYKQLNWKAVYDSDGFTTDYTMYMKVDPNNEDNIVSFVCVFGDSDIYRPDDGYYDFETDSYEEALEWFDDYNGFEDELEESLTEGVATLKDYLYSIDQATTEEEMLVLLDRFCSIPGDTWISRDSHRKFMHAWRDKIKEIRSNKHLTESKKYLNNREKQIYIDEIEKCEDREDLEDIVHEIFFYDKGLFALLRHFPKDASLEDLKVNKINILKDSLLDESVDSSDLNINEKKPGTWSGDLYIPEVDDKGRPYLPKEIWEDWE